MDKLKTQRLLDGFVEMQRGKWALPEMTDYERGVIDGRQMQAKSSVDKAVNSMANKASGTEGLVCDDIAERQRMGTAKYGTSVCANPLELRAWLQHAYEEALDQAIYLKRAIQELDK